VKKE
jgi:hypothetical protein